jgi:3-oxoacyl-[acyl-carrier protein] reductase
MGFGIAQALAAQGAHVVVNDFHQDRAECGTSTARSGIEGIGPGGGSDGSRRHLCHGERIQAEVGAADTFVATGIPAQGWGYTPLLQSPESEWNAWLQLNLHGLMHACQACCPPCSAGLGAQPSTRRGAHGHGHGGCAYGAAKAGAIGFIRNLSGEWARMA